MSSWQPTPAPAAAASTSCSSWGDTGPGYQNGASHPSQGHRTDEETGSRKLKERPELEAQSSYVPDMPG